MMNAVEGSVPGSAVATQSTTEPACETHMTHEKVDRHQDEHDEHQPSATAPINQTALNAAENAEKDVSSNIRGSTLQSALDQGREETGSNNRRVSINPIGDFKHYDGDMDDGCPVPLNIDLTKSEANRALVSGDTEQEDLSQNGAILWEVLIHDVSVKRPDGHYTAHTLVRYHHNRPIDVSKTNQQQPAPVMADKDDLCQSMHWKGPVFTVRNRAQGNLPGVTIKYPAGTKLTDVMGDREVSEWQQSTDEKVRLLNTHRIPAVAAENDIAHWDTFLVIKSPHLYQELRQMVEHYPSSLPRLFVRDVKDSWEQEVPYMHGLLLHLFPEIEQRVLSPLESQPSGENHSTKQQESTNLDPDSDFQQNPTLAADHLAILHRHLKPMHDSLLEDVEKPLAAEKPSIAFDRLWYVLKPGTEVYIKDQWTPWCFALVESVTLHWGPLWTWAYPGLFWSVQVWVLSSDGCRIARYRPAFIPIAYYPGLKELPLLDICPTAFWDAQQNRERREIALARGRILFKALTCGYLVANYVASTARGEPEHAGKVVVDHRRGQELTGLRLKPMGLHLPDPSLDSYGTHDKFLVNEPWSWGPQHLRLARGTQEHEELSEDSDSYDDEYPSLDYQRRHRRRARKRGPRPRKVLPLTADLPSRVVESGPPNLDGGQRVTEMSDEDLVLLYPLTFGFSLKAKKWIEIDATRLVEVERSAKSFDSLVMNPESLKILEAIIKRLDKSDESWSADFIEGKGTGGMILLHGPPGVGKTFTVEAIAEKLDSPLLALTVADIGTKETRIEGELLRWFTLAELWNAVLLIDEADIFLEQRHTRDLARNGLVSAFLRRAEYFKGLLFLTTNRVGHIDDAFISRIQVSIRYKALSPDQQAQLWERFFDKLRGDQREFDAEQQKSRRRAKIKVAEEDREEVVTAFRKGKYQRMNGRDIRNALQTAITLAEFDSFSPGANNGSPGTVIVEWKHFKSVLKMTEDFRSYVDSIRHQDEEARAQSRKDRVNEFNVDQELN